jgi:hypothetical protein
MRGDAVETHKGANRLSDAPIAPPGSFGGRELVPGPRERTY